MPKENIDYSNTIIYKIFCNDSSIKDIYVGHTTNFIKRKYQHKSLCNSSKRLKIYDLIKKNGGWDNWSMIEIAKYNCRDATEARIREQEHFDLLKPTITNVYNNEYCVLSTDNSIQHKDDHQENVKNYFCKACDYSTTRKYNYSLHLDSVKHKNNGLNNENNGSLAKNSKTYICTNCKKTYNDRAGLWRHKKKCVTHTDIEPNETNQIVNNNVKNDKLIEYLLNENKEIKELILEIVKNGITNTNTNITNSHNTTNSNNKAFNLNFFLNETCKNAMNITDFVDSIKLQLSDFMNMGEVGFVEGISNIIVKNLNSLDETVRPIHCTDQKRETFYLKDQNIWEKDDEEKKKMKQMIKSISYKNEKLMKTYKETYPDYNDPDSRRSDQYSKIMVEAMDCKEESRDKIIKNISKATIISKK